MPDLAEELGINQVPFAAVGSHDTASAVAAVPGRGSFASKPEKADDMQLKKLLADQIECTKQLNSREEEWLEKQGELEKILAS